MDHVCLLVLALLGQVMRWGGARVSGGTAAGEEAGSGAVCEKPYPGAGGVLPLGADATVVALEVSSTKAPRSSQQYISRSCMLIGPRTRTACHQQQHFMNHTSRLDEYSSTGASCRQQGAEFPLPAQNCSRHAIWQRVTHISQDTVELLKMLKDRGTGCPTT